MGSQPPQGGGAHDHSGPHHAGHAHAAPRPARPVMPGMSLLRLSLGGRLAIAGGLITLLWLAVLTLAR